MDILKLIGLSKESRIRNLVESTQKQLTKKKRLKNIVVERREFSYDIGLKELRFAIQQAEELDFPDRRMLHHIYREILRDNHLRSQIRTAINEVLSEPWAMVTPKGDISEDLTKMLAKNWFMQICYHYLMAEFDGTRLLEMDEMHWDEELKNWIFKSVSILPRENVVPEKGMLKIDPSYTTGIPYREAPWNTWLIEAGDPDNLGELQYCAKYAILKGFSLEDWARSGEKWSDPILIIRTDAAEDDEIAEKQRFAQNFAANSYAILNKTDDEVELLERKNADGYKINMELCNYVDAENSKGVNGQVATSQENAFVGSSEVQERILGGYTETRLKALYFFINETVIPFLVNVNGGESAYASLKGHTFMPLRFMKPLTPPQDPNQQPQPQDPSKDPKKIQQGGAGAKKQLTQGAFVSVSSQIAELYAHNECDCEACQSALQSGTEVLMRINIDETLDAAIRRLHAGKIAAGSADADLWRLNAEKLFEAVKEGSKYNVPDLKYGSMEQRMLHSMRYNTAVLAAFKAHHNSLEMAALLFDDKGKARSLSAFRKAVAGINEKYNKNHLAAERETALSSARSGAQWLKFKAKGGKLMYRTQRDGRVRDEHRMLDGMVKDVDDPIWEIYYTPNGWRCRCFIRHVGDAPDVEPEGLPELLPNFKNNPGMTLKIFTDDLPYFEVDAQYADKAANLFNLPMPLSPADFDANQRIYDVLIKDPDYKLLGTDNMSGGFVFRHVQSATKELATLSKYGRVMSTSMGDAVVIRQHVEGAGKQADYIINALEAELKTSTGTENAVKQNIRRALKQANHVVLNVGEMDTDALKKAVFSKTKEKESMQLMTVIYKGKVTRWTREQIMQGYFNP